MPEWFSRFRSNSKDSTTSINTETDSYNSQYEATSNSSGDDLSVRMGKEKDKEKDRREDGRKLYVKIFDQVPATRTEGPDPIFNIVYVNDDHHPVTINNEHFTGQAVFRCKDFYGWTPFDESRRESLPMIKNTPYFEGHKRTFSFQISGRFRRQWTADDVMFGTFFKKPLSLPRGYSLALGVAKRIDPSMVAYLDGPEPYMCSPLICAMNVAHIQPLYASPMRRTISMYQPARKGSPLVETLPECAARAVLDDSFNVEKPLTMPPWEFGGERPHLEENLMINWPSWTTLPTASSFYRHANSSLVKMSSKVGGRTPPATIRRNWFLDETHRRKFIYHPDTVYSFDFASPYVDLVKMKLKLGINIDVEPYLGDQPIRYECRSRDGKILFWAVELGRK